MTDSQNNKEQNLLNSLKGPNPLGGADEVAHKPFISDLDLQKDASSNSLESKLNARNQKLNVGKKSMLDPKGVNKQVLKGNSKSHKR